MTKIQPVLMVLTIANMVILVSILAGSRPAVASTESASVLRGRALEIVDDQGKVRASIRVYPATRQSGGGNYPETVLLRLITERGRPSVKLSTSEESAGLALVGPSGTKETYVQLRAKGTASSLKLKNEDGREYVVTP